MSVEYNDIKRLTDTIDSINKNKDAMMSAIAKELAARLLSLVVKRTLPGKGNIYVEFKKIKDTTGNSRIVKYSSGKNKGKAIKKETKITGGALRRGWGVDSKVFMFGNTYTINVNNNVFYATYVENGHRQTPGRYVPAICKRLKKSWVPGKHMLKISTEELQKKAQGIVEAKLKSWLKGVIK